MKQSNVTFIGQHLTRIIADVIALGYEKNRFSAEFKRGVWILRF